MKSDTFYVDINVTTSCNLQCKYCFVGGQPANFDSVGKICTFLNRLLQSKFFLDNYKMLAVNFWGGEPTLRPDFIREVISAFDGIGVIRFFIYSNGTKLEDLKGLLVKYRNADRVNGHPKLVMQVSYDGEPIHTLFRAESEKVRETLNWLDRHNIPFTIKSTVPYEGFKYMHEAYLDIKELGLSFRGTGFKNLDYFPTIEHYNDEVNKEGDLVQYEEDLRKSLVKIAKSELEDKKYNIFRWFTNSRAVCTAGKDLIAIDCDGKIYPCHGCLYEDKETHVLGDIDDPNVFSKLDHYRKQISDALSKEMCPECEVKFCLRCNHAKFVYSSKTDYFDKWTDGKAQPDICRFYNINNRVKLAFEEIRRRSL
jgi:uncharacterized protein